MLAVNQPTTDPHRDMSIDQNVTLVVVAVNGLSGQVTIRRRVHRRPFEQADLMGNGVEELRPSVIKRAVGDDGALNLVKLRQCSCGIKLLPSETERRPP
jgi:hypothetical protein